MGYQEQQHHSERMAMGPGAAHVRVVELGQAVRGPWAGGLTLSRRAPPEQQRRSGPSRLMIDSRWRLICSAPYRRKPWNFCLASWCTRKYLSASALLKLTAHSRMSFRAYRISF